MSIYLDEKNPGKHKPFEDASPDIVEYVRYLEVIAGKSANTAFSYFCDLRGFSRFMKRRRGLVPADSEMQDIDPKGLDTAFWASVTKEDIYEYLYFLNRECGNKKSSTARRLASLHGFYDYLVNQVNRLDSDPTAAIKPPKQDKVLPKYLTAEQSMDLLESTQTQSDFPERDYCMVVLFLNCGMRLSELVGMDLDDIDLEQRQIRLFGKGHKERMVYLKRTCRVRDPAAQGTHLQPAGGAAGDRSHESSRTERFFHPQTAPYGCNADVPDRQCGHPDPEAAAGPQQCWHNANLYPSAGIPGACRHRGKPAGQSVPQKARQSSLGYNRN